MKKKNYIVCLMCTLLLVFGMVSSVSALSITPSSGTFVTGSETSTLSSEEIAAKMGYANNPALIMY